MTGAIPDSISRNIGWEWFFSRFRGPSGFASRTHLPILIGLLSSPERSLSKGQDSKVHSSAAGKAVGHRETPGHCLKYSSPLSLEVLLGRLTGQGAGSTDR